MFSSIHGTFSRDSVNITNPPFPVQLLLLLSSRHRSILRVAASYAKGERHELLLTLDSLPSEPARQLLAPPMPLRRTDRISSPNTPPHSSLLPCVCDSVTSLRATDNR